MKNIVNTGEMNFDLLKINIITNTDMTLLYANILVIFHD
jgi:hypothetical protein